MLDKEDQKVVDETASENKEEKETLEHIADLMYRAYGFLKSKEVKRDKHIDVVKERLQEAMMWLNKNRASKGYFEKKLDTHVE